MRKLQYFGGELSSGILNDDYDSWRELSLVCFCLKDCDLYFTVDVFDSYFFEFFLKILAICETDMICFI